jgi:hypothetical protein
MKTEHIIAQCVDEVRSGRSTIDDCVKRYPGIEDLKPLLETALKIEPAKAGLSPESRARIRSGLLSVMSESRDSRRSKAGLSLKPLLGFRMAGTIAAILAGVAVAGGGTVYASQRSLPGNALYPVKTGAENAQLALTFGDAAKADLLLKFAQRRVDEMASEAARGNDTAKLGTSTASELDKALGSMTNAKADQVKGFARRLAESSLHSQLTLDASIKSSKPANKESIQKALDVLRRGKVIADVSFDNPSFLDTKPSVLDASLDDGQFKITGTVTETAGTTWQIDGVTLNNVQYPGNTPPVNSPVVTEGITHAGKTYVVKVEPETDASAGVSIQGTFEGTGDGGSVWYIGGIPVTVPKSITPPSKGDETHLRRSAQSAADSAPQVETKPSETMGVEYDGKLSAVDATGTTITVTKAGTLISPNISGAQIRTEDNRTLTVAQLRASLGQEVRVKGLYRKNGAVYATEVSVENKQSAGEGRN